MLDTIVIDNVFSEFSSLMHTRLAASIYTTEDSIRYTFFIALLTRTSIKPHEIVLEYPHPVSGKVDTYIPSLKGKSVVIEFKYDRNIPSKNAVPRPQNAGEIFADVYRLYRFTAPAEPDRLLIYCSDRIMAQYFRNPANGYSDFFDIGQGQTILIDDKFINTKTATFKKKIGGPMAVILECLWTDSLPQEHHLRIYKIIPQ